MKGLDDAAIAKCPLNGNSALGTSLELELDRGVVHVVVEPRYLADVATIRELDEAGGGGHLADGSPCENLHRSWVALSALIGALLPAHAHATMAASQPPRTLFFTPWPRARFIAGQLARMVLAFPPTGPLTGHAQLATSQVAAPVEAPLAAPSHVARLARLSAPRFAAVQAGQERRAGELAWDVPLCSAHTCAVRTNIRADVAARSLPRARLVAWWWASLLVALDASGVAAGQAVIDLLRAKIRNRRF